MRSLTLTKAFFAISALALPASLMTSCAIDGCIDNPSDARCTSAPTSDISVLTGRIPRTGGQINVQVRNLSSGNRVRATLGSGGATVTFTMNPDGTGSAQVSQAMLTSIPLGPLSLKVQVTDGSSETVVKELTVTLHIFTPASFTTTANITAATLGGQPGWVQIAQGHIFDTEDMGTNRRVSEYHIAGTVLQQDPSRNTHFGFISTGVVLDITDTQTVRLTPQSGQTFTLEYADLASQSPTYTTLKTLTYTKTYAVAADRKSTLVAVAGEGTDGPLKIWTLPPVGQQPAQVNITGMPSGKQPMAMAWGQVDNDSLNLTDLVVVHTDNSIAVYLQKSGQGMAYDQTLSTNLQTAAGLQSGMPVSVAIGDVDRDALDDVIFLQSGLVLELANEGNGSFTKTSLLNSIGADAVAVGDLNVDGKADLAFAQKGTSMLSVYPNQSQ